MSKRNMNWKYYWPYYKKNLSLAFPVMLTQIGTALVGFFDTMMVGHYSTTSLAAVSVSNAIFFTVMVLNMGILMGITPLISIEKGKKDANTQYTLTQYQKAVSDILHNGLIITIAMSLLTITILYLCLLNFEYFGQDPVVIQEAKPYFFLIILSIFPFLLFFLAKQFLEGLANTTIAFTITLCVNLLNIFLNWTFIYGHLGFNAMGATGAGWATLIARTIMPCLFISVLLIKKEWRPFIKLMTHKQIQLKNIKRIIAVGLPIGMQTFLETVLFTLSFIIIGWINKESLAAHNIANQIADMTFMLAVGVGAATTITVAYQYGKSNIQELRKYATASIHLVLFFNSISALVMIFARQYIPYLFTNDKSVFDIAVQLILCAGLFQYADGMQVIGAAILRGLTDVKKPMLYAFISYILIALPIGLFLTFIVKMNAIGMWIGFIIGLSFAALLFHYRIHKVIKQISGTQTAR